MDDAFVSVASVAVQTTTDEAQLYERHSDLVFRYCLRTLRSREEAEDATQTTFFQALRALRRGVVPEFEQAWLLTIARNECKTRHRAGSRRRRRELAHDPLVLAELAGAPDGPDGRLDGVRDALARLPEMQRRAFLLREWQGRSYADIARELGVSRPAVEALIFRARRGLVRELGEGRTTRRHALDLASLLSALKSVLGGGAAVKVAAGFAAVATVGTVAVTARPDSAPPSRARDAGRVDRPAVAPGSRSPRAAAPSRRGETNGATERPGAAPARRVAPTAKPRARGSDGQAPTAPASSVEGAAPQAPTTPPSSGPAAPVEVPSNPAAPPAAAPLPVSVPPVPPPTSGLPAPPPLPSAPALPPPPALPSVPPAPPVPDVPELPSAPDLPAVPDLP